MEGEGEGGRREREGYYIISTICVGDGVANAVYKPVSIIDFE